MITTITDLKKKKPIGETINMIKTCTYCKKEFEAKRIDKHYCSSSCRQLSHLQRKAVEMFGTNTKEEQNVKTTIDTSAESVKTDELNVKTLPEKTIEEKDFKPIQSRFIKDVCESLKRRDVEHNLYCYMKDNKTFIKSIAWVNVRLRCLIEVLLLISERKNLPLNDLIEITNAFICLNKSEHFKKLPINFPYHHLVKDLRDKLKVICIENEHSEEVPLKLNKRLKTELIVYRCELRTVASKVKFSELNFKTNKDE